MKHRFLFAGLLFLFSLFLSAETYNGTCGENLTWTLTDGVLTISGFGEMYDYTKGEISPWYSSRESIKTAIIKDGVTSIGDRAFESCEELNRVQELKKNEPYLINPKRLQKS